MTTRMQRKPPVDARATSVDNSLRPLAMAISAALLVLVTVPAQAQFSSSGGVFTAPGNLPIPTGQGNADLGTDALFVGNDGPGSFNVLGGSALRVGSLLIGASGSGGGNGDGTVLIDGVLTRVSLVGSGNRLNVGHQDIGLLTVSGGATLDARAESVVCGSCAAYIGNVAGSSGTLVVTGAGSNASFLGGFNIGSVYVDISNHLGKPGSATEGVVKVLAGGLLATDSAKVGMGPSGNGSLGSERSFASVLIDGVGSVWKITGDAFGTGPAVFDTATHQNAWATIDVRNGGTLWLDGTTGYFNGLNLTTGSGGGRTDMLVSGVGSRLLVTGDAGYMNVGRKSGTATLGVLAGASVSGLNTLMVGRDGSVGTLNINGAGSQVLLDGAASFVGGTPSASYLVIGRDDGAGFANALGGTGTVNVTGGGNLSLVSTVGTPNAVALDIARGSSATTGTLNIAGAGSVVSISAGSVMNGSGQEQAYNPLVRIGRDSTGILNVSGGGKLLIDGRAVSTNNNRGTSLYIGGRSDSIVGGRGVALVTGTGSEISMTGYDTYIGIGHGPQSYGQLTVANQGAVSTTGMILGRRGGVGVLAVDNASVNISGQNSYGAFLALGYGLSNVAGSVGLAGNGTANIMNGGTVTIRNMGNLGADLIMGGMSSSNAFAKGNGTLNLSGGSTLSVEAASGLARARIGWTGTGLVNLSGGSSLLVDGGDLTLATSQSLGSVGTVVASENSRISAAWVGIGRSRDATQTYDGGIATLLLNSGSTLTADTVVIGSKGYLGGSGGSIVANHITNYGTLSPGNSPGTLSITGDYTAEAGSRLILEVESNGAGGYNTDLLLFSAGSTVDLNAGTIEFRFLGATDPNAFQASDKFNLDTFLAVTDGSATSTPLQHSAYSGTQFVATSKDYSITNFSYSAANGAAFVAAPVPEPSAWAMMFAGIMMLGTVAARRRNQSSAGAFHPPKPCGKVSKRLTRSLWRSVPVLASRVRNWLRTVLSATCRSLAISSSL